MIKSVIFDFDGVIHNTFDVVYPLSRQIHGFTEEEYKDMFNGNLYNHKKINEENSRLFLALSTELFRNLQIEERIREELFKIRKKYDMYVVSSNSEPILNEYFENNNIIHIFEKILGVESHKSKVEKFKILKDQHGVNERNSIFITDTLGDILEANKVGLRTIAVDFGFHERERLIKGDPYKIISDFKDLLPEIHRLSEDIEE